MKTPTAIHKALANKLFAPVPVILLTCVLLLFCPLCELRAQEFKLFFANNVDDVSDFRDIESETSGLNWREVHDGDISGNSVEVDRVRQMFASTAMKGLDQQKQFWSMRDHTLLCFRIEETDPDLRSETYEVEVLNEDSGEELPALHVSHFFFVNVPLVYLPSTEYVITVSRYGNPNAKIRFKYSVYDWDNDNLYIFQLDRKRQLTGENYKMEYVTGYLDDDGYLKTDTTQLDLKEKSFQSFYVPEGSDLLDVVLIGDENKLRINRKRLHPGIDLEDRFMKMSLYPNFYLDKHEGRELINFNWLGSGLFEKYDTLFLSLYDERSVPVTKATMHVEQVDAEGRPTHNSDIRYYDYDSKRQMHRIITRGKPAYFEILAHGFFPTVYRYAGAADEETGFVDEDRCTAVVTLKRGRFDDESIVCSEQYFMNLNDEKLVVVRGGVDHALCSIDEIDLSMKAPVDTMAYMEDCGNDYPKLLDNRPIDRYAEIQVLFSRPHGKGEPECRLFATDLESKIEREATDREVTTLSANDYRSFERDYYFTRFSLLDAVMPNSTVKLRLQAGDMAYEKFPFFFNYVSAREEEMKKAEDEVNNNYTGPSPDDMTTGFANAGYDLKIPLQFKFNFKPVSVSTCVSIDIRKQLLDFKTNVKFKRAEDPNETKEMSKVRKELKEREMYESTFGEMYNNKDAKRSGSVSIINDKVKHKDKDDEVRNWVYSSMEDIFNMSSDNLGSGFFGGASAELKIALGGKDTNFQLTQAAGNFGYGLGVATTSLGGEKMEQVQKVFKKLEEYIGFSVNGAFELSGQADFGLRTFDSGLKQNWSALNEGYFVRISGKLKAAATIKLTTPRLLNSILNIQAGLRAGGKLGFQFEVAGPFAKVVPGIGCELSALAGAQAFCDIRTLIFSWSGTAGFSVGVRALMPDDDHNPFHKDFPYWIEKTKARPVGTIYKTPKAPLGADYGSLLVSDVAIDANPHFLDHNRVVYNDLGTPDNYNDDRITLVNIDEESGMLISDEGTSATNHNRSKRGTHEVVVYEQLTRSINESEVDVEHATAVTADVMKHTRVYASILKNGQWQQTMVSDADTPADYADLKPFVTIQEDGHAACVYQHGRISVDESLPADSLAGLQFDGHLMLKTFNGTRWSQATPIFPVNASSIITQYDLMMRNDTVLVAAAIHDMQARARRLSDGETLNNQQELPIMCLASVPISDNPTVNYVDEVLRPHNFFLNRVGQNAVAAILYEDADSLTDIFVKTLSMDGLSDGRAGADLGLKYRTPIKVKIVCDREADSLDDFALLWTENNNARKAQEEDIEPENTAGLGTILNASRIHLANTPQITAPIIVGAEQDSLVMTDFDGFLDDAHIRVVYTLANPKTGAAVIMKNDQFFSNSFEYDVSYARQSLLGGSTLPVDVEVRNTGTSAIQQVSVQLNDEYFEIDDAYVPPFSTRIFTVNYPISEDFDGYITSNVSVEYNNVFRTRSHPRNRALSFLRQQKTGDTQYVHLEDVECRVLSRSIEEGKNTFVVEVVDHGELPADMAVHVGIFTHPVGFMPISEGAEVMLSPSDFSKLGGKRKAFVTITADGVAEPTEAYVNCHIVSTRVTTEDDQDLIIQNVRQGSNAYRVQLFPTDIPTKLEEIMRHREDIVHHTAIAQRENGVAVSGIQPGETLRVFNADGICMFNGKSNAQPSNLFVPLKQHGTYILSTSREVYKFQY